MSAILQLQTNYVEFQSHRIYPEVWNGEKEWVAVPPELEQIAVTNSPYISVAFAEDNHTIIGITPTERPESEPPGPDPITVLQKENEDLKKQITESQLALAELYEMMTQGG